MSSPGTETWLDAIKWNTDGLVTVIAQDFQSGDVLTQAWMSREALALTVAEGQAVYWSRSRNKIWRKGEDSGHRQIIKEILLDCDNDALLLKVEQVGGIACHTGRARCFYQRLENNKWVITDPVIKDPEEIYKK
ncbi:MAG: phosphoribosyl-AMP cyclohydrolase [Gammaproteobacteria bacterium]